MSFILLCGCASLPAPQLALPLNVEIQLNHASAGVWRAGYQLDRQVTQLTFLGDIKSFRRKAFLLAPGFEIQEVSEKEVIKRKDGGKFSAFYFTFKPGTLSSDDPYPFSVVFSDGSLALHTGYLSVIEEPSQLPNIVFKFAPLEKENVFVNGDAVRIWSPYKDFDVGYVYFGNLRPIDSDSLKLLSDPNLPVWIQRLSDKIPPEIFKFYEQEFSLKPKVFVITRMYDLGDKEMSRLSGSAYPGWILINIAGADWKNATRKLRNQFISLVAHEGMHRFQGRPAGDFMRRAWLIEGTAEFFKNQALARLGYQNRKELLADLSDAANKCVIILGNNQMTLDNPTEGEGFYGTYVCGHILHYATHSILLSTTSEGMFSLWRKMLEHARARDGSINDSDYFKALNDSYVSPQYLKLAKKFISTQHSMPIEAIAELLHSAGVKFKLRPPRGKDEYYPQFQFL